MYAIIDWHYVGRNTYDKMASRPARSGRIWRRDSPMILTSFLSFSTSRLIPHGSTEAARWLTLRPDMQTWINIIRAYAPNNLILVGGPSWSQQIGQSATYPFTADNIAMVTHIYPGHWLLWGGQTSIYTNQVRQAITRYPVFATEWGFWGTTEEFA